MQLTLNNNSFYEFSLTNPQETLTNAQNTLLWHQGDATYQKYSEKYNQKSGNSRRPDHVAANWSKRFMPALLGAAETSIKLVYHLALTI